MFDDTRPAPARALSTLQLHELVTADDPWFPISPTLLEALPTLTYHVLEPVETHSLPAYGPYLNRSDRLELYTLYLDRGTECLLVTHPVLLPTHLLNRMPTAAATLRQLAQTCRFAVDAHGDDVIAAAEQFLLTGTTDTEGLDNQ